MPETAVPTAKPPISWLPASVLTITPILVLILVPWHIATHGLNWGLIIGFVAFWTCNGMAITTGYHRLWAHGTYKAHPVFKWVLALMRCRGRAEQHFHLGNGPSPPSSARRR